MARQAVTKDKQDLVAGEKKPMAKAEPNERARRHHTSQNSQSDPETRAMATMKDIDDLYTALQGLVPKPTPGGKRRGMKSGTDSDTSKEGKDSYQVLRRRYHSERQNKNRHTQDTELNNDKKHLDTSFEVRQVKLEKTLDDSEKRLCNGQAMTEERRAMSEDCLFVADNELSTTANKSRVQRVKSLPAYPEENENENKAPKKSRFLLFGRRRRHRAKPKPKTKKKLSWRTLLTTLSFRSSSTKKPKAKRSKNKVKNNVYQPEHLHATFQDSAQKITPIVRRAFTEKGKNSPLMQKQLTPTVRRAITDTVRKSPLIQKQPTPKVRLALTEASKSSRTTEKPTTPNVRRATIDVVRKTPLPEKQPTPTVQRALSDVVETPLTQKRRAPDPPVDIPVSFLGERRNTMEVKTDEVQKKLSAWYKYVVKETNYNSPEMQKRQYKSCESLLTDTEVLRARNAFSSDTDETENAENLRKVRVRKTRAKRNRHKERQRWRSLPNVKLVSLALKQTDEKKTDTATTTENYDAEKENREESSSVKHATSVSPLEAKISLGNSGEDEKANEEPMTDFMKMQKDNNSRWVNRQCSKTTPSYIRPLKLSLFYSESPSRETVHRSHSVQFPNKLWFTGNPDVKTDSGTINMLKTRRNSSRRRKRRSLKRQPRLPQESPFYFPTGPAMNSKFAFATSKDESVEDAKDSGIGSPDLSEEKVFGMTTVGKRKHSQDREYWESEDSGWASRNNHLVENVEHAVQTDSVESQA